MVKKTSTGMILDGVGASSAVDSSSESINIANLDISDWEEGRGLVNYEHKTHKDANGEEVVGKIIYAKKIFKESDCENDRQKLYWNQIKLPLVYIVVRLFDGAGHEGAKALAAAIRDMVANDEKILLRFSVDGSTLEKKGGHIERSIARNVAITARPCNKTCDSGLLKDPNAPEGFDKQPVKEIPKDILADVVKSDRYITSTELECNPLLKDEPAILPNPIKTLIKFKLLKAIAAGMPSGAPSTLTGGAALQKEDIKRYVPQVSAAIRDFKPYTDKEKFRKFLKSRMPECSDEYIDYFADVADNLHIKLNKTEEEDLQKRAQDAGKPPFKSPHETGTIRGKPLKPNPSLRTPFFDEQKGILHTKLGDYPAYNPDKDPNGKHSFHRLMNDPEVTKFHDQAMYNWKRVHKMFKNGTLPPEIPMHAAMLSILSRNTPVPTQELMYSRLIDAMHATGYDPRDPDFKNMYKEWKKQDTPNELPHHSKEFFQNNPDIILQNYSPQTGRKAGDIRAYSLGTSKFEDLAQYHNVHGALVDTLNKNKHSARDAVKTLVDTIPGVGPKVARYLLGMVGGGNIMVPDTHFSRWIFGLENNVDNKSIDHIKQQLAAHPGLLDSMERWYSKNSPAVRHILNRKDKFNDLDEESAIFPAFWKNWMVVVPHEKSRGMKTAHSENEFTSHQPYWDAINRYLGKAEDREPLPLQTAKQHVQWIEHYGEVPAMMLYYHDIVPQLLHQAELRNSNGIQKSIVKLENLYIELQQLQKREEHHSTIDTSKHVPANLIIKPAQTELLHGSDPNNWEAQVNNIEHGINNTKWVKAGKKGKLAIVKRSYPLYNDNPMDPNFAETAYHNIAHSYFGLGAHMPTTLTFYHPQTGKPHSIQEAVPNSEHPELDPEDYGNGVFLAGNPVHKSVIRILGDNGTLDKLAVMNSILGNGDRHMANWLISKKPPYLHLIDHGYSFDNGYFNPNYGHSLIYPSYLKARAWQKGFRDPTDLMVDPDVQEWLANLDSEKLKQELKRNKIPQHNRVGVMLRMLNMQEAALQIPKGKLTWGDLRNAGKSAFNSLKRMGLVPREMNRHFKGVFYSPPNISGRSATNKPISIEDTLPKKGK